MLPVAALLAAARGILSEVLNDRDGLRAQLRDDGTSVRA